MIALAPAQLATLHVFQTPFGGRKLPSSADQQLPQVLLTQSEMESEPEEEECSDGSSRCPRVAVLIRHALDDFLGDFSVFSKWAFGLEHAYDWLEGIAMNTRQALDFFLPLRSMFEGRFSRSIPVILGGADFGCGDQSGDRLQVEGELTMLPHPAGFQSDHAKQDLEHVLLPLRVEAAPSLTPLQIPVPNTWQDQQTECQLAQRHPITFDSAFRRCRQRTEHQSKMFDFLRCRFLTPNSVSCNPTAVRVPVLKCARFAISIDNRGGASITPAILYVGVSSLVGNLVRNKAWEKRAAVGDGWEAYRITLLG